MSNDKGELVGVKGKKWHPEKPFGMTLVPGGAYIMGKSDDDIANAQDAPTKTVTVRSFYMDETEVTNLMYMEYLDWTKRVFSPDEDNYKNICPGTLPDT